jgi:hypothetical protein
VDHTEPMSAVHESNFRTRKSENCEIMKLSICFEVMIGLGNRLHLHFLLILRFPIIIHTHTLQSQCKLPVNGTRYSYPLASLPVSCTFTFAPLPQMIFPHFPSNFVVSYCQDCWHDAYSLWFLLCGKSTMVAALLRVG